MTGPQHYREAERLMFEVHNNGDRVQRADLIARAQVEATLALAAATALQHVWADQDNDDAHEWLSTCSGSA